MQNYKLSVSKNGKKYTMVFKAETEKLARDRVHKEWYSILSIEETNVKTDLWNIFLFTVKTKSWELKNWKIVWEDIFKIYIKLKKHLEYDVIFLYSEAEKDIDDNSKSKIINDLKEEYNLLFSWNKKKDEKNSNKKNSNDGKDKNKMGNFYLKKELEETYKLIQFILDKLEKLLFNKSWIKLDTEAKEKIKTIYNSIIKLKKTTNISKLKEIWELALLKIWKLELNELENHHEDSAKILLKETNSLLKKIGSRQNFIEKDKDISYIIKNLLEKWGIFLKSFIKNKKTTNKTDKNTHSYIKNILFLKRYKQKLKDNNIFILKNLLSLLFSEEKRVDIFIRRKVIKQNITLFEAKEKWMWYSYTSVKKWLNKIIYIILKFIKNIKDYLFIVIFIYTIMFIVLLNINYYYKISNSNFEWLFYFIVVLFIYLILYFTRNLILMILNFVILFFIVIFWVVNF